MFHGDGLSAYESDLHVSDASIHHGRGGPSYYIELRDYSGLFEIPRRDYISAFGSVEGLRPEGYCVKVTIQRTGHAERIIADRGTSLPAGSLQRCPASVG